MSWKECIILLKDFLLVFVMPVNRFRSDSLWEGGGDNRKHHLVKWSAVMKDKTEGGRGVRKFEN